MEIDSVEIETANKLITTTAMLLTHAYALLAADVLFAVFAHTSLDVSFLDTS